MNAIGASYRNLKITEASLNNDKQILMEELLNFYYSILIRFEKSSGFSSINDLRILRGKVISHELIPKYFESIYSKIEIIQSELFNVYSEIYYLINSVIRELNISEESAEMYLNNLMYKIDQEEHEKYCNPNFAPKIKSPKTSIHY